jgi:putative hemolysin
MTRTLNHKDKILAFLMAFLLVSVLTSPAAAMLPADVVYCRALGYEYMTVSTPKGPAGVCVLPNGEWVNSWKFYTGQGALEWSYCAQQGFEAKRGEIGDVCEGCTICVMPTGEDVWVVTLMGLSFQESVCGDGHCGTVETSENCPSDCPSGGVDAFCDGVADTRCDPDCVGMGGNDPDCPGLFVDIKAGSCPNPLNVGEKGTLPVAILGTVNLDVTEIDPATIRLTRDGLTASIEGLRWEIEDVATPNPAGNCQCWTVPGDRRPDLVVHFDVKQVVDALGLSSEEDGNSVPLTIRANLKNGSELSGTDCVRIKTK